MNRREVRDHCFKMLFGIDFYPKEEQAEQIERYLELNVDPQESDREYLKSRVEAVMEETELLDARIEQVTEGWTTKRMGKVELAILRLALYEMTRDDEIPQKVAINEAVELAKRYGGDDSSSFVNGILAKLV